MGKKVLIISSTPRKGGNSDKLCDAFAEGARSAGHEVEKLRIADMKIGYCTGCYACQKLGRCAINDDAAQVLEKMMASDVIVFSSPVYFYSISAQLKALFDRTVAIYPKLVDKVYYYLFTMADTNTKMFEGPIAAMRGFLDCYEGSKEAGMVCASGVYELGAIDGSKSLDEARSLGEAIQ